MPIKNHFCRFHTTTINYLQTQSSKHCLNRLPYVYEACNHSSVHSVTLNGSEYKEFFESRLRYSKMTRSELFCVSLSTQIPYPRNMVISQCRTHAELSYVYHDHSRWRRRLSIIHERQFSKCYHGRRCYSFRTFVKIVSVRRIYTAT